MRVGRMHPERCFRGSNVLLRWFFDRNVGLTMFFLLSFSPETVGVARLNHSRVLGFGAAAYISEGFLGVNREGRVLALVGVER